MKLYRIKNLYLGKDLDDESTAYYTIAENDFEIYKLLAGNYGDGWLDADPKEDTEEYDGWAESYGDNIKEIRERILKNKGDFQEEYLGEFYDIKWGWEEIGDITDSEIEVLKKFKLLN